MDLRLSEALSRVGLEQDGWQVTVPQHSRWLTAGIWELTEGGRHLVVKRLARQREAGTTAFRRHWSHDCESVRRWSYWLREPLAYQSGVVGCFADEGLRAPLCIGVDISFDDAVLAMDFVDGTPAENWHIDAYAEAARCLGAAQGRIALGDGIPDLQWLSQGFLRAYSTEKPAIWGLLDDDRAWDQPVVARNFPKALRSAANELHAQRDRLYSVLESLPRTLCHLDFWTKNLIQTDDGFVLLDWAFIGDGALGEDVGNLVPDAAFDFFVEPGQLPQLREATLDAYLDGLGVAGWHGDPRATLVVASTLVAASCGLSSEPPRSERVAANAGRAISEVPDGRFSRMGEVTVLELEGTGRAILDSWFPEMDSPVTIQRFLDQRLDDCTVLSSPDPDVEFLNVGQKVEWFDGDDVLASLVVSRVSFVAVVGWGGMSI